MQNDLETIGDWLAGTYSNRQQALEQAVWFVPVTLWYRVVPGLFPVGVGFFTEQVSQHQPERFYRSRVLQLLADPLRLENYKLRDQSAWAGSSQDPVKLARLSNSECEWLPGCTIFLERREDRYCGKMRPGSGCRLNPTDTSYIQIEFELTEKAFLTLDRGFDAATGQQTWGSKAGAYHYLKQVPG